MPFPLLALLAPAIAGAASAGINKLLNRGPKKNQNPYGVDLSPQEIDILNQIMGNAGTYGARSTEFFDRGGGFFDIAKPAFESAAGYWNPILSGDRSAIAAHMGPELDAISDAYETARKNILATAPRGGGRTYAMQKSRYDQARDVGTAIGKARPQAAQALLGVGGAAGQAAGTAGQLGVQAGTLQQAGLSDALAALTQRRGQQAYTDVSRRGQNIGLAGEAGRGLGSIIAAIIRGRSGTPSISGAAGDTPYVGPPYYPKV